MDSVRLALGTASALGLARFAYGLLVPAMRTELGWSLADAGTMATANSVGYLAGALVTAALTRRLSVTVTFRLGMIGTAIALAATAVSSDYVVLLAVRGAAGLTGALVFVTGGVIAAHRTTTAGSPAPVIIYFSGAGLGIAMSGATIPLLLHQHPGSWPLAWVGLAVAGAIATALSWTAAQSDAATPPATGRHGHLRPLWRIAVAYLLFAAGYIAYITFLSAYLVDQHVGIGHIALTWTLLGLGVVAAPALWSRLITSLPGTRTLTVLLLTLSTAALLALTGARGSVLVSAIAYGATFMGVPAAITAIIRVATPADEWTSTLAAFTALFAVGQTAGPWLAGALADRAGSGATVVFTAALCTVAACLSAVRAGQGVSCGVDNV